MHVIYYLRFKVVLIGTLFALSQASVGYAQQAKLPIKVSVSLNAEPAIGAAALSAAASAPAGSPTSALPAVPSAPAAENPTSEIIPLQSTIEVNAALEALREGPVTPYRVTQAEILSSAGT